MFTIDPYYDIIRYNESIEALKNNSIDFTEFVYIKPPYNWYIECNQVPIIMNYDLLKPTQRRFVVPKVKGLRPNEDYHLLRKNDSVSGNLAKYVNNKPLQDAYDSDYAVFFKLKNNDEAISISKEYPGKIWFFGKYLNNRIRVFLATNNSILAFISRENILLEKNADNGKELKEIGRFEAEFNYRVLLKKDFLKKYTETPYFENGVLIKPNINKEMKLTA